jgi:hypothetical protein
MSLSRKVGNKKPLGSIAGEAALQEGAVLRGIVIESLYLANNPAVHQQFSLWHQSPKMIDR